MMQVKELIKKMTLREKLGQMTQLDGFYFSESSAVTGPISEMNISEDDVLLLGSVLGATGAGQTSRIQENHLKKSRLSIPLLFMADVIHGYRTIFPIPIALGCTWNPELVERAMAAAVKEASVAGVHVNFSPMADMVRDPRWGRVMETTGEDPYLNSLFAKAFVKAYQGSGYDEPYTLAACVKHFAGYGGAEAGRDYNTVELSNYTLRDQYLPAYKAAVDAGCDMVMTSFNTLDGVPSTANAWLLRELLRKEWGFNGVIISDWGAVKELIAHGVAEDDREAALKSITAGTNIEMMTTTYLNWGEKLVEEGLLDEALIDEAVERILELKVKLGLFENPYRYADTEKEKEIILCKEHRELAYETAVQSLVLLKNENNILPLDAANKKVALIGPFAESRSILGGWSCEGRDEEAVSLKEGLEAILPADSLYIAKGCDIEEGTDQDIANAIKLAEECDVIIAALGEHAGMSGEAGSRAFLTLPGRQQELLDALYSTGKEIIVVLFNGRPLDLRPIVERSAAVLEAWFPGTEGGNAIASVLSGKKAPSGRLTMSFPYTVGQIPVYYNHLNTGRPKLVDTLENRFCSAFLDIPNKPLFPFGYGLTYTTFEYADIQLDNDLLTPDSVIRVSAVVKNTGSRAGVETVQLYIRDITGSRSRPVKELKGFERIELQPGEARKVTFDITEDMLKFTRLDGKFDSEAGRFTAMIGTNADETLSVDFILEK